MNVHSKALNNENVFARGSKDNLFDKSKSPTNNKKSNTKHQVVEKDVLKENQADISLGKSDKNASFVKKSSEFKNEKVANETKQELVQEIIAFDSFGAKITKDAALNSDEMLAKYYDLKVGDTINMKFSSTIKEVCSKKGCWMKLLLDDKTETMVRFKDYGFFMPLDAAGKEVIVAGKAFVNEVSVADLKHYAEDAGKSPEEIADITEPAMEFAFEANGVLLKK